MLSCPYLYMKWIGRQLGQIVASFHIIRNRTDQNVCCYHLAFPSSKFCSCANSDLISDANAKVSTQEDVSATYFLHKKTQETMTHTEGWASSGGVWLSEAVYSYTSQRKEAWAQKATAFRRTFSCFTKERQIEQDETDSAPPHLLLRLT